jgi:hypothetical protein
MSESFWAAVVNGLVLIALAWVDRRAKARDEATQEKLASVVHQTNSMKNELVEEVRKGAHAEGVKEVEDQQRASE